MARYTLPQYQSVYRDPQSVAINTELRNRFSSAFLKDDEIAAAVDAMQAADFEGDMNLKNELTEEYNAKLKERADRGNYEHMGMAVTRDARGFLQGYRPIQQNYANVQAYKKRIQESYDAGNIDAESYRSMMAMSSHDYQGLQKNEDGSIDEGSFFSGYNFINDVDVSAMMDEKMKGYVMHEGGSSYRRVSTDEAGRPIEGGRYEVKIGEKWKQIPSGDVDAIFSDLLAEPGVQAYLRQKADLRTYDLTDEDIQTSISTSLHGDPKDETDLGLKGALQELINSGKTDDKTKQLIESYEQRIKQQEALLSGTGVESEEELINLRNQAMKQEVINSEINRERKAISAKYVRTNVWTEYEQEYDKMYLARYKQYLADYVPTVYEDTGVSQINAPSGTNTESVTTYINKNQDILDDISTTATELAIKEGYLKKGEILTVDDILNGKIPEGMEGLADRYKNQIYAAKTQMTIAQRRLQEAKDAVNVDKAYKDIFMTQTFGDYTGQDILKKAQEIVGKKLTEEEFFVLMQKGQDGFNVAAQRKDTMGFITSRDITSDEREAMDILSQLNQFVTGDPNVFEQIIGGSFGAGKLGGALKKVNKKISTDLNTYLEANSKIDVGGMTSSTMPGLDNKQVIANTKAVKNHFENRPLNTEFEIFYNGQKQDGTGNVASLREDLDWDEEAVTVSQVTFDTTPYMGEPTLQFKVKGKKDGKVVTTTIKVPYSNLQQAGMDQYFNDPGYRMQLEVNMARHNGLADTQIGLYDKDGNLTSSLDWQFAEGKSAGDIITYTDVSGKKQSVTPQQAQGYITDAGRQDTREYLPTGERNPNYGKPMHTFRTITN